MGRILGIDFGTVRIGIALSDTTETIASSKEYIRVKNTNDVFKKIESLVRENNCKSIVIGLPISLNGQDTEKTKEVRIFVSRLEAILNNNIPIIFQDERLSSYEANNIMQLMNTPKNKRKEKKDSIAAQIILQTYLNNKK